MRDEQVLRSEGITVRKSFDEEGFPVPAVRFEIEAERDESATVRVSETLPEQFGIEQIGFHPDYGKEYWTAHSDGTLHYEREISPNQTVTTVYGVRMTDGTDPTGLLGEPEIAVNPSPLESGTSIRTDQEAMQGDPGGGSGSKRTDQAGSASPALPNDDAEILSGSIPNTENTTDSGEEEPDGIITPDAESPVDADPQRAEGRRSIEKEPADREGAVASGDSSPIGSDRDGTSTGGVNDDAVVTNGSRDAETTDRHEEIQDETVLETLLAEIESGAVGEPAQEALAEALPLATRSDEVRIEHLESRLTRLEAYTDALEAFIDAAGTSEDVTEILAPDITALESRLGDLETTAVDTTDAVDDIEDRLEAIETQNFARESDLVELSQTQQDLRDDVDELDDDQAELSEDFDDLEDDLEGLEANVDELENDHATYVEDFEDLEAAFEEVTRTQDSLAADQESIEEDLHGLEGQTDALTDRHEVLSERVGELDAVQESLVTDHQQLEDDHGELEATVDTVREQVQSLADRADAVAEEIERIERLRGDIDALDERLVDVEDVPFAVQELEDELDELTIDVEGVSDRFDGVEADLDGIESQFRSLESTVAEIETALGDFEEEFDALETDIERIRQLGEQFSNVF